MAFAEMKEHLDKMRGMVMIAYPAYHGLPNWEYVVMILEEEMDFKAYWPDCNVPNILTVVA